MVRISRQALNECRIDLYDQCQGLAATLEINLADFAGRLGIATDRELAMMRNGEPCIPISSIPRLAILMMRLQDQVNAAYFRQLQEAWPSDEVQGELFPYDDEFDDCPF